jgi:hypothetical protein
VDAEGAIVLPKQPKSKAKPQAVKLPVRVVFTKACAFQTASDGNDEERQPVTCILFGFSRSDKKKGGKVFDPSTLPSLTGQRPEESFGRPFTIRILQE